MIILIAIATLLTTLIGGLFALRFKDHLHLILGFSAGAVVGVAFFDLLPEAFDAGFGYYDTNTLILMCAVGFLSYLVLDRVLAYFFLVGHEEEHAGHIHVAPERGSVGAVALSFHSLLDGVAVGLAFQASPVLGGAVALAVLAHDFSDGINTVSMIVRHGGHSPLRWLFLDALAPSVGMLLSYLISVPEPYLGPLFALFAGFFLYIGASDLIPESHHAHPKLLTTVTTICGAVLMYFLVSLV